MLKQKIIFTIGHSTLKLSEFLIRLKENGITLLVDIRSIPRSRYNPQFNEMRLSKYLRKHGIKYVHLNELGGLRHSKKDSINTGWHNESFRGFADYMLTKEFKKGLKALILLSKKDKTAIMCAEAVPWRCHRTLIADMLVIRKYKVLHIIGKTTKPHSMTSFADVKGTGITYPGD